MAVFAYGVKEIEHLRKKDKKLGLAIDRIGPIEREVDPDPFSAIIGSIVSQQISNKAAETVLGRLLQSVGAITPQNLAAADASEIQKCGMSYRKAGYIMGVAQAAVTKSLDFDILAILSDEEIIKKLSALQGVGVWTAEMLLIFSLQRPNVVSFGDLAIRRGMMNLYGLKELKKDQFAVYKKRYTPYGSVASLYLWALSVE